MKKGIIISLLLVAFFTTKVRTQNKDSYTWFSDVSIGFLPIAVTGTSNVGDESKPIYEHTETSALMINLVAHFGASIPFYITKTWSTGAKLSTGFGYQNNLKNVEGLSSFVLNFPNYLYYRNYSSSFDFSVLLGYQFTYTALNSHLMLMGIEYNIDDDASAAREQRQHKQQADDNRVNAKIRGNARSNTRNHGIIHIPVQLL